MITQMEFPLSPWKLYLLTEGFGAKGQSYENLHFNQPDWRRVVPFSEKLSSLKNRKQFSGTSFHIKVYLRRISCNCSAKTGLLMRTIREWSERSENQLLIKRNFLLADARVKRSTASRTNYYTHQKRGCFIVHFAHFRRKWIVVFQTDALWAFWGSVTVRFTLL